MSKDIHVNWYRGGSDSGHRLSSDRIPLQRDNMSMSKAAYYGGVAPYFRYYAFVNSLHYAFHNQDLLIDTDNIDPRTGLLAKYRIINIPEDFPDGHYELVLDQVVGT